MKKGRFTNKKVLVTGSSRGIGKAIAYLFGKEGATVFLNGSKDKVALEATTQHFREMGIECEAFLGDLGDYPIACDIFRKIGTLDILVNNAGISHVGLFQDTPPSIWESIMQSNLSTAYHCCYLAVPNMIRQHSGSIINISSIWGSVGASCEVAYATSKSALDGLTRSLAKELGPSGIRVNAIACGWIDTAMNAQFSEEEKVAFLAEVPLGRTGTPQEVANLCAYLASEDSAYLTGQIITLDGGLI